MLSIFLLNITDSEEIERFTYIFEKYQKKLINYAETITQNYHSAENAVQQAFFSISQNMHKVMSMNDEQLEIYIFKVTKNSAIDEYNCDKKFSGTIRYYEKESVSDDCVQKNVITNDLKSKLTNMIKAMDITYRDVASLHFLYEMSPKEIASSLNLTAQATRTRLSRARKMLKNMLKENKDD